MGILNFLVDTDQDERLDSQSAVVRELTKRIVELELKLSSLQSLETRLIQLEKNSKEFKDPN